MNCHWSLFPSQWSKGLLHLLACECYSLAYVIHAYDMLFQVNCYVYGNNDLICNNSLCFISPKWPGTKTRWTSPTRQNTECSASKASWPWRYASPAPLTGGSTPARRWTTAARTSWSVNSKFAVSMTQEQSQPPPHTGETTGTEPPRPEQKGWRHCALLMHLNLCWHASSEESTTDPPMPSPPLLFQWGCFHL